MSRTPAARASAGCAAFFWLAACAGDPAINRRPPTPDDWPPPQGENGAAPATDATPTSPASTPTDPPRFARRLTGVVHDFDRRSGIVYARPDRGTPLRMDLYRPELEGPHPFVIVIPGGGWRTGNRAQFDAVVFARALATEGIAAATIDHRRVPFDAHPAQLDDCVAAVDYLQRHAAELALDPSRWGLLGCSSGGHLAALTGLTRGPDDARPRCVVALSAPHDLGDENAASQASGMQIRLVADFVGVTAQELEGLSAQQMLTKLSVRARAASPRTHVDPNDPPTLLIHGDRDNIVPVIQSQWMAKTLAAAGVPHELRIERGRGHVDYLLTVPGDRWNGADGPPFWGTLRSFVRTHLLGP